MSVLITSSKFIVIEPLSNSQVGSTCVISEIDASSKALTLTLSKAIFPSGPLFVAVYLMRIELPT